MPNYTDGKIYKIICLTTGMIYVGSTTQPLCKRLAGHKAKTNRARSKKIIEEGNYIIVLIENYPCNSIEELNKREYEIIESTTCINRKLLTEEERKAYQAKWRADHKDYHAKWCENHEGYKKMWYHKNKELGKAFQNYEQAITKN
jgi:hypothetical protein